MFSVKCSICVNKLWTMETSYVHATSIRQRASGRLLELMRGCKAPPVIVCIGSDRVTGDALGPLVGHLLTTKHNIKTYVYGTLNRPVTALNLSESAGFIKQAHPERKVLAVDAALGKAEDVGLIRINKGGVYPGSAVAKTLPKVGDYSIIAVVNRGGENGGINLNATRLSFVFALAEAIAGGINDALKVCSPLYSESL